MQKTIYINGVRATKTDLKVLLDRVYKGLETILEAHTTKNGNTAIVTA